MVLAFQNFKEIESLQDLHQKHRAWLKHYEGQIYSIADEGKHKIKWKKESKKYSDNKWDSGINMIKELPNRLVIDFDDKDKWGRKDKEKIKKNLEEVKEELKRKGFGFIVSTHNGSSDYIWIEFKQTLTYKKKEAFLKWIAPENSEIDLNFASNNRVFPVLYASHWRHSIYKEKPIEYFEGEKIDFDSLGIPITSAERIVSKIGNFDYYTFKKATTSFTMEGQTENFLKIQPLFYDKNGNFWLWDDNKKKWFIVDDIDILNMIHEATGEDTINSKNRTEILNALKQFGRKKIPKEIKPTWIQFKNKIVDFITGEEFEATPEYFLTNPIPHKLHNQRYVETPIMDRIFEEWVGKDFIKTLYQIIAYCLIPDYPIHRLFCLVGSGLNGKSCFMRLLRTFIGEDNVTSTELDTLLSSRFEVTRLYKKLVCIMGETNFSEMSKTSIIKKLTGQDLIGFEYKNKNPFEGANYAKILIATNNLPTTTDKTLGFYRRWLIIDFPNQFSEKKDILCEIPYEEYEILANKCLIILSDLLNEREFYNEGTIEQRAKKYEDHSDPLEKFLKEYTEEDTDGFIWKFEFEKKLNQWCKENRFRQMSEVAVGKKMKEKGIEQVKKYSEWLIDGENKRLRAWSGIKWKISVQDVQDVQVNPT